MIEVKSFHKTENTCVCFGDSESSSKFQEYGGGKNLWGKSKEGPHFHFLLEIVLLFQLTKTKQSTPALES